MIGLKAVYNRDLKEKLKWAKARHSAIHRYRVEVDEGYFTFATAVETVAKPVAFLP